MHTPESQPQAQPRRRGRFAGAREALSVFADPNYRWYWIGSFGYYTGLHMEMTARAQLAYDLSGSAMMLGVAAISQGLPSTLMSILGGTLADRWPKRKMLLVAQMMLAVSGVLMFALLATGLIEFWHLVVIGVLRGLTTGFSLPARLSMVSEVVPENQFLKAYSLYYVALNTMRIGGPSIAGILIGLTGGTTLAFLIIGIAHIVGLFALLPVRSLRLAQGKRRESILQDIGGMFSFAWSSATIMVLLGAEMGISLFASSVNNSLLPIFSQEVFHQPRGVGLATLQAAAGGGGLVGSMLITAVSSTNRKPLMLLTVGMVYGSVLILFANSPIFFMATATIGLVGVCQASYTTLNSTLFQLNSPPEMRGRATTLYLLGNAASPIGTLPIGYFSDMIGVQTVVTITGSLLIAYMLSVAVLFPAFRRKEI